MAITIKDVARETGCSITTVSLVLNKKETRISQKTRDRIIETAQRLAYHPNQIAAGLASRRTRTLGLVMPDITNSFFANIAGSVEAECEKRGYSLFLCNSNEDPAKDVDYIYNLMNQNIAGIMLIMASGNGGGHIPCCTGLLAEANVPLVFVDRFWPSSTAVNVYSDNEAGGYLAARALLERGHRRIGFISGTNGTASSNQRLYGYIRALQEYGVPFSSDLVAEGNYKTETGYLLGGKLMDKGVTAIFAANDMMALGVYRQAAERKISIPGDLSVIGYDNVAFTEFLSVPLTTVEQPTTEIGITAVTKIMAMINGEADIKDEIFLPKLIERESIKNINN